MVRSIGIDPGERVLKVVELDGSYRKTRLVRATTTPVGAVVDDPMRPDLVAEAARAALDEGMRGEVTLGHPCREAVLRSLELPFKGSDAIKKVVKSEIEGEIYTHTVDDMIVDFHEIGPGSAGGTRILVASVPKVGLRNQLTSLAAHDIEPEVVDLDTMALWRAAHHAGAFAPDDQADDDAPGDAEPADQGPPVHAVVDLGARSVRVILVENEQLLEMRALRLGDAVVVDHVARQFGLTAEQATVAVEECLRSGDDAEVEAVALPSEGADAGEAPVAEAAPGLDVPAVVQEPETRSVVVGHAEVEAAHTKYLQRLARELTRFLTASGLASRIRRAWITGGASRGPGVSEMLAAVFGVEPRELDVLGAVQHDLDPDEAERLGPQLATAIGLALGRLGGPEGFQLRQEDLALMRGFERVKFPLAIACMVSLLALFVYANRQSMELKHLELELGQRYYDPENPKAVIFHGLLNPIFASRWFEDDRYFRLESRSGRGDYTFKDLVEDVTKEPVYERIKIVRDRLKAVADQKQKESGVYEDVSLESGLAVLVRWSEIMKGVAPELGRYLVPRIDLNMKGPSRRLEFTIAFRGDDFRSRMAALKRAVEADYARPDSPFEPPKKAGDDIKEDLFSDSDERGVSGAYFRVTIAIKESFDPFGPSSRVGVASPARPVGDALAAANPQEAGR